MALAAASPIAIDRGQPKPLALADPAAQAALDALSVADPRRSALAWRWDGTAAHRLALPPDLPLASRPSRLILDLRGDGGLLLATLDGRGVATVHDGSSDESAVVWRNEAANWRVTRIDGGDPNHDGRIEMALLLWKPDEDGVLRSHPFLMGWRGGHYRIVWGGSATMTPIQDLAVGDLDGDGRDELIVLEGGDSPGDPGTAVSIWRWHGWGFQQEWRSPPGQWRSLTLHDMDGDAHPDVIAAP